MASRASKRWLRFDLKFVLFWIVPYVAVVFAVLGWRGPYASDFLNDKARETAAIGFTLLWVSLWASKTATRQGREEREAGDGRGK